MTTAEAVETSVTTTNSLFQDYTNRDNHILQTSTCNIIINKYLCVKFANYILHVEYW